jgi:hypothetical protein
LAIVARHAPLDIGTQTSTGNRAMIRTAALIAAAALLATPVLPAVKAKRANAFTDISGKKCVSDQDGALLCKGLSDWQLEIADEGNIIQLRIWRTSAPNTILEFTGRGLGDKAEWRGMQTREGFSPDALIIRMRPVEDDLLNSSLLYVIRLNPAEACFSGLVDAKANGNAHALARSAADKLPGTCDPHPQIYGKRSKATDLFNS